MIILCVLRVSGEYLLTTAFLKKEDFTSVRERERESKTDRERNTDRQTDNGRPNFAI